MRSRCVLEVIGFVLLTFYFLLGLSPARHIAHCVYIKKTSCTCFISQGNSQQPGGTERMLLSGPIRERWPVPQGSQVQLPPAYNIIYCLPGHVLRDSGFCAPSL